MHRLFHAACRNEDRIVSMTAGRRAGIVTMSICAASGVISFVNLFFEAARRNVGGNNFVSKHHRAHAYQPYD